MKQINQILLLSIVVLAATFLQIGCSENNIEHFEQLQTDSGVHVYKLHLDIAKPSYDGQSTRSSAQWEDGDSVMFKFYTGYEWNTANPPSIKYYSTAGKAVYNSGNNEWELTLDGELNIIEPYDPLLLGVGRAQLSEFEARYYRLDDKVAFGDDFFYAVYYGTGSYEIDENDEIHVSTTLEPCNWRMKFRGLRGSIISVWSPDITHSEGTPLYTSSSNDVSFPRVDDGGLEADTLSLLIAPDGSTPYIHGCFVHPDEANSLTIESDGHTYTRTINGTSLRVGESGYIVVPNESNYEEEGWTIIDEPEDEELIFDVNGVQFKMIRVEGGTFQMGSNDSDAYDDEKPVHSVTLSDFSIGQTEVTQALWYAVMGYRPTSGGPQWMNVFGLGDEYPAYFISWNDCQEFIEKLNMLTGRTFRMPTEAEWEYAACGGNSSHGYKYSGSNDIDAVAWYTVNSYDKGTGSPDYGTHRVATKAPNELGIYDMSGNVWEWCQDWYGLYTSSAQINPTGLATGSNRVFRGGSWFYSAEYCRVVDRRHSSPESVGSNLGLRLALEVEGTTPMSHTSASPSTLTFGPAADKNGKTIQVTSNESWTAKSDATWCKVTPASGSNDGTVTVTVTDNTSTTERIAHVTIKGTSSNDEVTVSVTQKAISDEELTFSANGVQFKMIKVKGGTFQMGSNDSEADSDEKPVHRVTLSDFSIGQTEVTQELWEAVMGSNPSYFQGLKLPVENVSWNDCQAFITKLKQLTGNQFRLPTDAEWEYAARGGNSSRGYKYSGSNDIDAVAWYASNSSSKTHEVATKAPNEIGIYDMSGNVYEWCQDWYGYYSSSPTSNPKGPTTGSSRVVRGGGWRGGAIGCRVAHRSNNTPTITRDYLGFRLAL